MTRGPYEPTPAALAYAEAKHAVSALIDSLVVSGEHGYRARVLLAADHPPPSVATEAEVRAAVAATAPAEVPR